MKHVFYPSYLLASRKLQAYPVEPQGKYFGQNVRTLQWGEGESGADAIEKFAHKATLLGMEIANAFHGFHYDSQIYASFKSTVLNTYFLLFMQFRLRATTALRCAPS